MTEISQDEKLPMLCDEAEGKRTAGRLISMKG